MTNLVLINKIVLGKAFYPKDEDSHLLEYEIDRYDSVYGSPNISIDLT